MGCRTFTSNGNLRNRLREPIVATLARSNLLTYRQRRSFLISHSYGFRLSNGTWCS